MFYKLKLKDNIRVPPRLFDLTTEEAILKQVKAKYAGYIAKELGIVIDVSNVHEIKEGVIIPGGTINSDYLRRNKRILEFVSHMNDDNKLIGAICHAGWVLISAKILKNRIFSTTCSIVLMPLKATETSGWFQTHNSAHSA